MGPRPWSKTYYCVGKEGETDWEELGEAVDAIRTFCAVVKQFPRTEMVGLRKAHFRLKKVLFPPAEVRLLKIR